MAGGQLPSGLSLTGVGVLGGTPTQAGSFSFSAGVKDSNGSTATANLSVSIAAPSTPVINGISPPSGPISGGTAVTVSGSNFASGASVTFGGTAAASVVVSSSSQIQVVTPNHVAGNIGIIVSANGQSSSSSANFTYTAPNNGPTAGGAPAPPSSSLSIAVSGNRLVSGSGAPIRLLGVNVQAPWVGNSGPISSFWQTQGSILATYNANVVRIPLDEDCWLNINGQASQDGGSSCSAYPSDVLAMVNGLHAAGLYAILDLQFTGPGSTPSTNNGTPMPDADHATAFWQSVATTFKDDPAVLFDLFNEPTAGTWSCWLNGCDTGSYNVVGFQSLINTVRAAGATTQPIMLGGLDYSNDLSEWLANEPSDSSKSLVASFHNYGDNSCNNTSCWASTVETTNSSVPVVTGEFGEGVNGAVNCAHTFVDSWMSWADGFQISYLAWWYDGHGQAPCSEQTLDLFQLWPTPGNNYLTPYGADIMGHMQTQ